MTMILRINMLIISGLILSLSLRAQNQKLKEQIFEQTKNLVDLIDYKTYKRAGKTVKVAVVGFEGLDEASSYIETALTEYDRVNKNRIIILPRDDKTLSIIKQRYKEQKADFFDQNDKQRLEGLGITHIITGNYYPDEDIFYMELVNRNAQIEGMVSSKVEKNTKEIENYKIAFDDLLRHYKVEKFKDKPTNVGVIVNKNVYNYLLPLSLFENQYRGALFTALKRNKYNKLKIVSLNSKQIDLIKDEVKKESSPYFEKDGGINLKREDLLLMIDVNKNNVFYKLVSIENIEQLYSGERSVVTQVIDDKKEEEKKERHKDGRTKHFGILGGAMYTPEFAVEAWHNNLPAEEYVNLAPIAHAGISLIRGGNLYLGLEYAWSYLKLNRTYTDPEKFNGGKLTFGTYIWKVNPALSGFYLRANSKTTSNIANIAGCTFGLDFGKGWIKIGGEAGILYYSTDMINGSIPMADNLFDEDPDLTFSLNLKLFF